jgi:hypothetical protein
LERHRRNINKATESTAADINAIASGNTGASQESALTTVPSAECAGGVCARIALSA